jgi:hypothetical protein
MYTSGSRTFFFRFVPISVLPQKPVFFSFSLASPRRSAKPLLFLPYDQSISAARTHATDRWKAPRSRLSTLNLPVCFLLNVTQVTIREWVDWVPESALNTGGAPFLPTALSRVMRAAAERECQSVTEPEGIAGIPSRISY